MQCTVCGTSGAKKVERKNYRARYNGEPVEVSSVDVFHCGRCGEDFLTPEEAHALSVAVKNEMRKKYCLLPPDRIVAIRQRAGITQHELECLLGQAPKVVTRWESGKVIQNSGADTVLRLIERDPSVIKQLRAIEKTRCSQQQERCRAVYAQHEED